MANNKNNMIPIPLNGDLNFSKLKTKVQPYSGFNDLNSPVYGDAITPLHFKKRDKNAPGNDRPYLGEDGILYDKYGVPLLNTSSYKGIKRTELNLPASTLAAYDADNYVSIEIGDKGNYTAIHYAETDTDGKKIIMAKALPYVAINAQYSEASQHLLFIAEKRYLHVYDTVTREELANTRSVDSDKCNLVTFYDPLNNWNIVSSWEPFADWKYKTLTKYTAADISEEWKAWEQLKNAKESQLEDDNDALEANRAEYDRLKEEIDGLIAEKKAYLDSAAKWDNSARYNWNLAAAFSWTLIGIPAYIVAAKKCEKNAAADRSSATDKQAEIDDWHTANDADWNTANDNIKTYKDAIAQTEKELQDIKNREPEKEGETEGDQSYFIGKCQESYNFIFDQTNNTFTRKQLQIPFDNLKEGSRGPDADSYVITGIYDMHLKSSEDGKWIENTDEDYIRYRLAVIPHDVNSAPTTGTGSEKIFFMLNYSPKIYFRNRDTTSPWIVGSDIKSYCKTYLLTKKNGITATDTDFFITGTGRNAKPMTWMSVLFAPLDESGTGSALNFNDFNLAYDLGEAKYNFYSPWSTGDNSSANSMDIGVKDGSDATTATGLGRGYFNFEISGSGLDYEKPTTNNEVIKLRQHNYIFREIVNNGLRDNISICENEKSMGTMLETMGSLDDDTPLFYRNGKDGQAIVFKTNQQHGNKWIEITVTDKPTDIKILDDRYAIIMTANNGNTVDLDTRQIRHFAPDWNNRFSLCGSPYIDPIAPITLPASNVRVNGINTSKIKLASGINSRFEVTGDPISGYSSDYVQLRSNESNITPVGFISDYDIIDWYYADMKMGQASAIPSYYTSMNPFSLGYSIFTNIDLAGVPYPSATRIPGLFCSIKPSNFGRFYLDDEDVFYSLLMYNGKVFYAYYENSVIDDIKELFMVQGQTYAITKSDYLYSVFVDQRGVTSLADAIANVKGLRYCGAIPEMAVFFSPLDRTLKSFTADHMIKDLQSATAITNVGTSTYNPQTNAIYIPTNNGCYVFSAENKYRLPIFSLKEVYFGGWNDEHTYFIHEEPQEDGSIKELVTDYVYNPDTSLIPASVLSQDGAEYEIQPIILETRYYGQGQQGVSVTDCVYFRLYSDKGPVDSKILIREKTLTDGVYTTTDKELNITKSMWDKDTNTCYVRYQPAHQRSVGISIKVISTCAISEITFSVSNVETSALSKPLMNM